VDHFARGVNFNARAFESPASIPHRLAVRRLGPARADGTDIGSELLAVSEWQRAAMNRTFTQLHTAKVNVPAPFRVQGTSFTDLGGLAASSGPMLSPKTIPLVGAVGGSVQPRSDSLPGVRPFPVTARTQS